VTVYTGPATPRWSPRSEAELRDALTSGLVEENHYLEFKRAVEGGQPANRELARDLAQFAIDGGTLVVGVAENDGRLEPTPVELAGLPERIEQIALTAIDPPLYLRTEVIPSADAGLGYVVVHVPASPRAPHMVQHVYMGRGDKTKIRLSDADVTRLHSQPQLSDEAGAQLLDELIARDPVPEETREQAHFFAVASPVRPTLEMALHLVHGPDWQSRFRTMVNVGLTVVSVSGVRVSSELELADQPARRPDGAAFASLTLETDRSLRTDLGYTHPEDVVEVELSEDGQLRLYTGRFSDVGTGPDRNQEVLDSLSAAYTRQLLAMAMHVGRESGYRGPWLVGVAATGIEGLPVHDPRRWNTRVRPQAYAVGGGVFRNHLVATTEEIEQAPGTLTYRLVGRLLRALGRTADAHADLLADNTDQPV
jgi:hypothetical protein